MDEQKKPRARPDPKPHMLNDTDSAAALTVFFGIGKWQEDALCAQQVQAQDSPSAQGKEADKWFPYLTKTSKQLCLGCPVQAECLQLALAVHPTNGIWAGYTIKEINHMRKIKE